MPDFGAESGAFRHRGWRTTGLSYLGRLTAVLGSGLLLIMFWGGSDRTQAEEEAQHSSEAVKEGASRGGKDVMPDWQRLRQSNEKNVEDELPVPPPPFSYGIFPCSDCHNEDMPTNMERRTLEDEHDSIELHHGPRERWCFDCHNPDNRDVLRLASGATVEFTESYLLCGQCHGPKLRDWRAGVHGKRTGEWDGKKQYLLCAHCHNPHAPRFPSLKPMPPPTRPENIR